VSLASACCTAPSCEGAPQLENTFDAPSRTAEPARAFSAERRICRVSENQSRRDRFSMSWLTSSGVAFHRLLPRERSLAFYPVVKARRLPLPCRLQDRPEGQAVRCSAALLGMISLASRFALLPEGFGAASRDRKTTSSGASYQLASVKSPLLSDR
jgi:hypothetical protein